jgi:hypothetical protein
MSALLPITLLVALSNPGLAGLAATDPPEPEPPVVAEADANGFGVESNYVEANTAHSAPTGNAPVHVEPPPPTCDVSAPYAPCTPITICIEDPRFLTGGVAIAYTGVNFGTNNFTTIGPCTPPAGAAANLPALVLRAFQRIPLPEPHLDIQPPKGKTLIGLETIFSTQAEPFNRTLTLLGRRVELRIHATSYDWIHGDDTSQTTDWAGRPWERGVPMERYISHAYEDTGSVNPTVRVTWTAEYRVNGGAWQPVNGTVDRGSPAATLVILEAEPKLVAP